MIKSLLTCAVGLMMLVATPSFSAEDSSLPESVAYKHGLEGYRRECLTFSKEDCASSTFLYRLSGHEHAYILKGTAQNLINKLLNFQSYLRTNNVLPVDLGCTIILPEYSGVYEGQPYVLLKEAIGLSFKNLFDKYLSSEMSASNLNTAFTKLAESIARLHTYGGCDENLMTRLTHKDLHADNIFYHDQIGISLIDNDSFDPDSCEPITTDIKTILLQTLNFPILLMTDEYLNQVGFDTGKKGDVFLFSNLFLTRYSEALCKETLKKKSADAIVLVLRKIYWECVKNSDGVICKDEFNQLLNNFDLSSF